MRNQKIIYCLILILFLSSNSSAARLPPVEPGIHPELKQHTEHFKKKVYKVTDRVYSAVGWNVAGIVMIIGDDGVIMVDAGLSPETSREVLKEFRKITDKPVIALIYSHFHHDHIDGVKGLVNAEQVNNGQVEIYAHSSLMDLLVDESAILGPILGVRTGYTFGFLLEGADVEYMNGGIGPLPTGGRPGTFIRPTKTINDQLNINIAGVNMQIIHVPSEAPDELVVYLPDTGVLIDTEVIQGPTFPNMHTLRGTKFRDPVRWVESIDRLRKLKAKFLVPTHGQPVYGQDKVEEVLSMTRDGIQYVHDQTIRYMNRGLTPDELVEVVKLPPHLDYYSPYLRQYYGTVKQAVRQIYVGYLGWYEGDPVKLDPVPVKERAIRMVALMGGRDRLIEAALASYNHGDYQWAAELTTYLIRIDNNDMTAREIKAKSFRQLGYKSMNINWRNWYITSALELEGKLDAASNAKKMANVFMPPDIITEMPADVTIRAWTTRLKSEDTLSVNMSLGFVFTDLKKEYALTIRHGICQFDKGLQDKPDIMLTLTKPVYDQLLQGNTTIEKAIGDGKIKLDGDGLQLKQFLAYFEQAGEKPIALTVH